MSEEFCPDCLTDIFVRGLDRGVETEKHFTIHCAQVVTEDQAVAIARILWPELSFVGVSTENV